MGASISARRALVFVGVHGLGGGGARALSRALGRGGSHLAGVGGGGGGDVDLRLERDEIAIVVDRSGRGARGRSGGHPRIGLGGRRERRHVLVVHEVLAHPLAQVEILQVILLLRQDSRGVHPTGARGDRERTAVAPSLRSIAPRRGGGGD